AVHVRLEHAALVFLRRLVDGVAAEREPRRVDEDVARPGLVDEALATRRFGDVERKLDVGLEPLDAARAADDSGTFGRELSRGRSADAARGSGDDRRLAVQLAHGAGRYPARSGRARRAASGR